MGGESEGLGHVLFGPQFPHLQTWGIEHDDPLLPLSVLESDVASVIPREPGRSSLMDTGHLRSAALTLVL